MITTVVYYKYEMFTLLLSGFVQENNIEPEHRPRGVTGFPNKRYNYNFGFPTFSRAYSCEHLSLYRGC